MFYTYVLVSKKNKRLYIGSTEDLKQRFNDHNRGLGGTYTSNNKPFLLVYYEAFLSKSDAIKQEHFYKTGYGKEVLHGKIEGSLKLICPIV